MLKEKKVSWPFLPEISLELVVARHYSILGTESLGQWTGPPKQLWWGLQARMGTLVKELLVRESRFPDPCARALKSAFPVAGERAIASCIFKSSTGGSDWFYRLGRPEPSSHGKSSQTRTGTVALPHPRTLSLCHQAQPAAKAEELHP